MLQYVLEIKTITELITKMGADSSAENTPNAQKFIYLPNLSAQAQKVWISMKKSFIGRP